MDIVIFWAFLACSFPIANAHISNTAGYTIIAYNDNI